MTFWGELGFEEVPSKGTAQGVRGSCRGWGTVCLGLGTSELSSLHRGWDSHFLDPFKPGEALMEIPPGLFVPFFLENTPVESHKPTPLFFSQHSPFSCHQQATEVGTVTLRLHVLVRTKSWLFPAPSVHLLLDLDGKILGWDHHPILWLHPEHSRAIPGKHTSSVSPSKCSDLDHLLWEWQQEEAVQCQKSCSCSAFLAELVCGDRSSHQEESLGH